MNKLTILDAPSRYTADQALAWAAGVRAALQHAVTDPGIANLVRCLHDAALKNGNAQQLRDVIAQLVEPAPTATVAQLGTPTPAVTVTQFCEDHSISRTHFYELAKQGKAPRLMKLGRRVLISQEAAADWRRRMETETP